MSDVRESVKIGTTLHSFQSPEKENKIHERKGPKHICLKINYAEITSPDMYIMKYLLGLKLINTSKRVASFTKLRENGNDSCNNKFKAATTNLSSP